MNGVPPAVNGRKSVRLAGSLRGAALPVPGSTRRRLLRDDLLLRVKIEAPAGDPARLSEAQRRRIEHIAALTRGEMTKEEFLAAENPSQAENITLSQEDLPMHEEILTQDPALAEEPTTKRKYVRKPKALAVATPAITVPANGTSALPTVAGPGSGSTVRLTPEQASKLWEAVTGGQIFIGSMSEVTIEVTLDSFPKALPVLLDWMGRA